MGITEKKNLRKKRTKLDFSKHELSVTQTDGILIHDLKVPGSQVNRVKFINAGGVLAITGDYGNWILCREFHPSDDGYVSDSYWCEKIRIASTQNPYEYDEEATKKEIEERLEDEDVTEEEKSYYEDLLEYYVHESETCYKMNAHSTLPSDMDHENVPYVQKLNPWLECIFDAFEEICERLSK